MGLFRFLPSEVLAFIDADVEEKTRQAEKSKIGFANQERNGIVLGQVYTEHQTSYEFHTSSKNSSEFLTTLLHMCDHLDTGATHMPPKFRVRFVQALEHLRLARSPAMTTSKSDRQMRLENAPVNPVWVLHEALTACRDVPQADKWPELAFLQSEDAQLWERLGAALSDAHAALSRNQYRSATVVSVYVMESLLGCWWERVKKSSDNDKVQDKLHLLIQATHELFAFDVQKTANSNKQDCAEIKNLQQACEMAASYRNLIHPDKQKRTGADHDQGTAMFSLGTVLKLAQRIGADLDRRTKPAALPA